MQHFLDKYIEGEPGSYFFNIDQTKGLSGGSFYLKTHARRALQLKLEKYLDRLQGELLDGGKNVDNSHC